MRSARDVAHLLNDLEKQNLPLMELTHHLRFFRKGREKETLVRFARTEPYKFDIISSKGEKLGTFCGRTKMFDFGENTNSYIIEKIIWENPCNSN
jgi:hypothetical protein